jgi:hypothetical protein
MSVAVTDTRVRPDSAGTDKDSTHWQNVTQTLAIAHQNELDKKLNPPNTKQVPLGRAFA